MATLWNTGDGKKFFLKSLSLDSFLYLITSGVGSRASAEQFVSSYD